MNIVKSFFANAFISFWRVLILLSTPVKKLLNFLNDKSGALLAIGTLALVFVTYLHIDEATRMRDETKRLADSTAGQLEEGAKMRGETKRLVDVTVKQLEEATKMRLETKRMADLSVEQFKIRSYPSFLVVPAKPVFEDGELLASFKVHNKGEITAFQTTTMTVFSYKKGRDIDFSIDAGALYEYEGRKTTVDVENDLLRNTVMTVTCRLPIPKEHIPENLSNALFFIKFKVPYVEKYSYRQYAFHLSKDVSSDKKQEKGFVWIMMNAEDSKKVIKGMMSAKELSPVVTRMKETFFGHYEIK